MLSTTLLAAAIALASATAEVSAPPAAPTSIRAGKNDVPPATQHIEQAAPPALPSPTHGTPSAKDSAAARAPETPTQSTTNLASAADRTSARPSSWRAAFTISVTTIVALVCGLAMLLGFVNLVFVLMAFSASRRAKQQFEQIVAHLGRNDGGTTVSAVLESEAFRRLVAQIARAQIEREAAGNATTSRSAVKRSPTARTSERPARSQSTFVVPARPAVDQRAGALLLNALRMAVDAGATLPDGEDQYSEFDWCELQSFFGEPLTIEEAQLAIRQIDSQCRRSPDERLCVGNLIKVRHLRSPSGHPNFRIGVRSDALAPLLQDFDQPVR